jgi:hypothetical protein
VAERDAGGKVDFKKSLDCYQARQGEFRLLDVLPMHYLMVDGKGDPNTAQEYAEALQALYPVAYSTNFTSKRELRRDYVVRPLEALWWAPDMAVFTSARDKSQWHWTTMLMVPDCLRGRSGGEEAPEPAGRRPLRDARRGPVRAYAARRLVRRRSWCACRAA